MSTKSVSELVPGDIINMGEGRQVIVATERLPDMLSILLEDGQAVNLRYDIQVYVFGNLDKVEVPKPKSVEKPKSEQPRKKPYLTSAGSNGGWNGM